LKTVFAILKWTLISFVSLMVLLVGGLLIFYQTQYKETPLPKDKEGISTFHSSALNDSDKSVLFPLPQKVEWLKGHFSISKHLHFTCSEPDASKISQIIQHKLILESVERGSGGLILLIDTSLGSQAYHLLVNPNSIKITYGDRAGLYYALTTLSQLAKQTSGQIPCISLEDKPDLKTRGAMLDISRGKVPTLETMFKMVDFLSDLKYNHLELYIEGFSFAYPSFKNLWEKTETPFTPEEFQLLDAYCKDHFIELVPNQNSLGHMGAWLSTAEFKDLAECPEGYKFLGLLDMKTTIAPKNPQSLALVKKMSEDLLPNFSSNKFNVNLDEPFELGKNKNHPIQDPKEVTRVYLDYAKQLNAYVEKKGKKMFMWGDVISRNPEFASQIPEDITLLEWRYEDYQDFDKICKKYQESKRHYMVCPGTSSWSSFTGRTGNMVTNVENSVKGGIRYGADGMIITDWGDTPHLQYFTVSYPGLAYGAALSWHNDPRSKDYLGTYLSRIAFQDSSQKMGDIVLNLGNYYQFEEYPMVSGTMTSFAFRFGMMEKMMTDAIFRKFQSGIFELVPAEGDAKKILVNRFTHPKIYNYKAIVHFVDSLEQALNQTKLGNKDHKLILDEYKNAIRTVKLGAELKEYNNYHLQRSEDENKRLLSSMKSLSTIIIREHKKLWDRRNKSGGYDSSIDPVKKVQAQVGENLALLDQNFLVKGFSHLKEKLVTSAAVLFLE